MATPRAAIRYAKSLFSLAEEQGSIDAMEQDVQTLSATIEASDDLELMLQSPVIKADAKEKILVKIFEGHIGALSLGICEGFSQERTRVHLACHHA